MSPLTRPGVELTEGAPWCEVDLTDGLARVLSRSEIVKVAPGPRSGLWKLRDNGYVGAARLGTHADDAIEIRVTPKTPVDRLLFLLGYARKDRGWRREEVDAGEATHLLPALAHAFVRAGERALRRGVLMGYVETEESSQVVRGRIREADQLRRRYNVLLPLEVRYDDFTIDVAENQLLLGAAERLLRFPRVGAATRRQLHRMRLRLAGVRRALPGRTLPRWQPSRLNSRYQTALGLAELVLRGASYELDSGATVRVDGLLLEMWRVFEEFAQEALADALARRGHRARIQDRRHHLDLARAVSIKPDLVVDRRSTDGRSRPVAVVDMKYKLHTAAAANADLYQLLAYCTALGLSRGYVVYAGGGTQPRTHTIQNAGIEVVEHSLDLSAPPGALLSQVDSVAADIAGTPGRAAGGVRE